MARANGSVVNQESVMQDRRTLWCAVYQDALRRGGQAKAVYEADLAVKDFDKRFNPKEANCC